MKIGMIGLGRMGANMAERLVRAGHEVMGYDRSLGAMTAAEGAGIDSVDSLERLVAALDAPRVVWIMVPAGDPVDMTIGALKPLLSEGDIVIDGGNSYYGDTARRAADLAESGLRMVDVGTSGGVWGLDEGYALMIGGDAGTVEYLSPIFEALAPAPDRGWGHVGPSGAGHFVKMVHNGIEYGLMQAYAEGFSILKHKEELGLDLHQIAEIWRYGSVVRSWLLDLTAIALKADSNLTDISPWVSDSGEGRWTVQEAIDLDVPAPVITLALIQRLRSRDDESYADRLLAAMREQFGGHAVRRESAE
jgi:6-phosphogluconate dehydrogenase